MLPSASAPRAVRRRLDPHLGKCSGAAAARVAGGSDQRGGRPLWRKKLYRNPCAVRALASLACQLGAAEAARRRSGARRLAPAFVTVVVEVYVCRGFCGAPQLHRQPARRSFFQPRDLDQHPQFPFLFALCFFFRRPLDTVYSRCYSVRKGCRASGPVRLYTFGDRRCRACFLSYSKGLSMQFKSQLITQASGSIGGTTFTRNSFSSLICRARSMPVNPGTNQQGNIRSAFTNAVTVWESLLTDSERSDWTNWAHTLTLKNRLGEDYTPSGRQMFIAFWSANQYAYLRGLDPTPPLVAAPTVMGSLLEPSVQVVAPAAAGVGFGLSIANASGSNTFFYSARSIALSNGRNFWKGPYDTDSLQWVSIDNNDTGVIEFLDLTDGYRYAYYLRGYVGSAGNYHGKATSIIRGIATAQTTV